MSVSTEDIRDFVLWLAEPLVQESGVWADDRPRMIESIHLQPTAGQVTMIYGARKALQIMERLSRNSDAREADIAACGALFDRMLGQCAYGNKPKPDAEVDINREDLPALGKAATYLVEFSILKMDEAKKQASFNKSKYADRGRDKGNG